MRANANKRRQTLTNASKRRGENASKRKQTRANVDKRKQTLTPPFIAVFYTPLCNPLKLTWGNAELSYHINCAPKLPESRGERTSFHGQPNLSPIFRESSCAHFSWQLRDENRWKISPIFSPHFSPMSAKNFARISLSGLFGITN